MEMRTGFDMLSHMELPCGLTRRYVSIYLVYLAIASQTYRRLKQFSPDIQDDTAAMLAFKHSAITFVDRDDFEQDVTDISEDLRIGDEVQEQVSGSEGEGESDSDSESESESESVVDDDTLKDLYEQCLASGERFHDWQPDNRIQTIIKNSVVHAELAAVASSRCSRSTPR